MQTYCQREGIKWRFNVEAAPWWGGFFERMVKSVKLSLKKCLGNARLNFVELSTALVEVEAVLNSRPLTYVYDEMEEPLTPSHLTSAVEFYQCYQGAVLSKLARMKLLSQKEQSFYNELSITSGIGGDPSI